MNTLIDSSPTDQDLSHRDIHSYGDTGDREISLGTTMILGIFFALAVLCAVFFGFGYALGAKHTPAPVASAPMASPTFNGFKPAPGSPLGLSASKLPPPESPTLSSGASSSDPAKPLETSVTRTTVDSNTLPGGEAAPHSTPRPVAAVPLPGASPVLVSAAADPLFIVQVAAVSHREDADLIAGTLQRRGYAVAVHQETQDKLLHVQIGPFPVRKDAEVMRQRLLADGFNAYIK